jgi:hypothetical protein
VLMRLLTVLLSFLRRLVRGRTRKIRNPPVYERIPDLTDEQKEFFRRRDDEP